MGPYLCDDKVRKVPQVIMILDTVRHDSLRVTPTTVPRPKHHLLFFMPGGGFGFRFGIPRSTFWPGELFKPIFGSRKTYFCEEMILWWGYMGFHPAQINSMVPGIDIGRLLCHQTPLKNKFSANSPKSEKLQVAPATSPWPSLFPLVAVPIPLTAIPELAVRDSVAC